MKNKTAEQIHPNQTDIFDFMGADNCIHSKSIVSNNRSPIYYDGYRYLQLSDNFYIKQRRIDNPKHVHFGLFKHVNNLLFKDLPEEVQRHFFENGVDAPPWC